MNNEYRTVLCAVDMEEKIRAVIGTDCKNMIVIIVPTMKEGTFIIANVKLEEVCETLKSAMAGGGK